MFRHKGWLILAIVFLVLMLMLTLFLARPAIPAAGSAEIDPRILDEMAAAPDGMAGFLVVFREQADLAPAYAVRDRDERGRFVVDALQSTAGRSQAHVRAWLEAQGIAYRAFFSDNSLYLAANLSILNRLAAFPEVAALRANAIHFVEDVPLAGAEQPAATIPWNIAKVGADRVWQDFGIKGQGIVVATLDTGAEYTHDALFPNYKCGSGPHDDCWYDPTGTYPTAPGDGAGRGTHLMGILAGDDDPSLTYNAGMAPDAQWIACKGCTDGGACAEADLNACADWLLAPNGNPGNRPDVIALALNSSQKCDGWFLTQIMAWRAAGIYVSARGGSNGPACDTMRSPGSYEGVLASGPTDQNDIILSSSSRGPGCSGGIKPEVAAPGANICSTYPGNTWNCGYSGTSFSTAHSAGLAALLYSAEPGLIGNWISTTYVLTSTALCIEDLSCGGTPCPDGANNVYGWGRIDAYAAVAAVLQPCEPVTDLDFSWTPVTPTTGQMVTFSGWASGTEPITYSWMLDVGSWREGQTVTHTYAAPGVYTVVLTATNCGTATAVVSHSVTVQPCEPVALADFSWTPPTPNAGEIVTFTGWVASGWVTETVDEVDFFYDGGGLPSLALDSAGRPHISYQKGSPTYDQHYAYWDGSAWNRSTVDTGPSLFSSLVVDGNDHAHLAHGLGELRYSFYDGSAWQTEVVDPTAHVQIQSLALDAAGHPHISYDRWLSGGEDGLVYAYYDGSAWLTQTVDGGSGTGVWNSLALDAAGRPRIKYVSNGDLRYAWFDGTTWYTETIASGLGEAGGSGSLVLDSAERPHISYHNYTNQTANYAYYDGSAWITATVDGSHAYEGYTWLVLDSAEHPVLAYFDALPEGGCVLKYARWTGSSWQIEVIDRFDEQGFGISLQLDDSDRPHIAYHVRVNGQDGALRYARLFSPTPPITLTWSFGDGSPSQVGAPGEAITHTYDQPGTYTAIMTATNCQGQGVAVATHTITVRCIPVQEADFSWTPLTPTAGQMITLTGWGATGWLTGTIVTNVAGFYPSLALGPAGLPHISLSFMGLLYYHYDGLGWQGEHLSGCSQCVGCTTSLAVDAAGRPHVSCRAELAPSALVYMHKDAEGWHSEIVDIGEDGPGLFSSLALDAAGRPHISYCYYNVPYSTLNLAYVYYDGTDWVGELVDADIGPMDPFHYTSLSLDALGRPHIAYMGSDGLKHAWYDGTNWQFDTVERFGGIVSLALDSGGRPHLAYYKDTVAPGRLDLVHAYFDGSTWITETVMMRQDRMVDQASRTSLVLDAFDRPHIAYDYAQGTPPVSRFLEYAWHDGTGWFTKTIPGPGFALSLGLGADGRPRVGYIDYDSLLYASWPSAPSPPLSYTWDLGDGTIATGMTVTHAYAVPGTYTVMMTATNCAGQGEAMATHTITVQAPPCEPVHDLDFSWTPITPTTGQMVAFSGWASGTEPITYSWMLEVGSWKKGQIVTHTYDTPGVYTVVLTGTNCATATATVVHTVTVACPPVTGLDFSWEPPAPAAGQVVTLTAAATSTLPITYSWMLDVGSWKEGQVVTYSYALPGTYTVVLTATNGCDMAQTTDTITVTAPSWRIYLPIVFKIG